ncbi:MAG: hypothetical protein IH861_12955 [Chloroflexi bacterium]|nr:hypothetical protein [Chloroflexota bacterium]
MLTMMYVDSSTISNSQEGKVEIKFDMLDNESPVRIISDDKDKPFDGKAKVWFDSDDIVGDIGLGGTFLLNALSAGENKLKADKRVDIFNDSGDLLQTVKFHTSCSKPLLVGDRFGGVLLVDFVLE